MQVQSGVSIAQTSSLNSSSTNASSSLNSSTEFQDYVNKRMYEIQSDTSVSVSGSETKTNNTTSSDDKKTDSTDKKDTSNKKTDTKKQDKTEVNEEAAAAVINPEAEQLITDDLLAMLTGAVEENLVLDVEEVIVAVETGEIQVIDLKQAKLATNELAYEEPKMEEIPEEIQKTEKAEIIEIKELVPEEVVEEVEIVETKEVEKVVSNEKEVEVEEVVLDEIIEEDGEPVIKADVQATESSTTTLSEIAKEEEVVFIKVGDTKLDESWQKVLDNMGKEIIAKEASGIDKFMVVLNPEGLGEVKIEVLQQNGGVLVNLLCSQTGTANLLNDNLLGLTKLLEANFGDNSTVIVAEESQESGEREMNQENSQKEQQEVEKIEELEEIEIDFMERMRLGLFGNENVVN